ncbi:MAG: Hpt domain-containing protein [Proteobacteria bacterium]|nr:MAG: Hpt domain-containing protein [Pseudomonadota bacterium]
MDDQSPPEKKHLFTKLNYLLDLEYLKNLEIVAPGGDIQKFMSEISILFLREAPNCVQELNKALGKADLKGIKNFSFRLRGVCSGIGAKYMIDLCHQIEAAAQDKDVGTCRVVGDQLNDALLVTRDQVQAYMAQLPKTKI